MDRAVGTLLFFLSCGPDPDDVTAQMKYRHKRENKEHRPRKQTLNIHIRDAAYVTSITRQARRHEETTGLTLMGAVTYSPLV